MSDVPIHLNQFKELLHKIKQLQSGDNTSLIDANVVSSNDATKNIEIRRYRTINKRHFFYLSKVIRISVLICKIFYR